MITGWLRVIPVFSNYGWKVVDVNPENGFRTEPYETPALGFIWLEKKLFMLNCLIRPTKKSESQRVILVGRSNWNILYLSPLCQTLPLSFFDVKKSSVPDQIGTLSQVGTKRSQKEAGPFKNFLSHVGTMYLSLVLKDIKRGFSPGGGGGGGGLNG